MAFLKIISGHMKGEKFEIDRDEVVLGRSHENLVRIDDSSVSGKHCSITRDGRKYTLKDLDSTNGTFLNGVKITEYRLSPRDIIKIGSEEILIEGPDIEADENDDMPPTVSEAPIKTDIVAETSALSFSSPFGAQRKSRRLWIIVLAPLSLLALCALAWFVYLLFF